jgi:hypothetical protein
MKFKQQKHKQFLELWMYDICSYFYIKYIDLIHDLISLCSCYTIKSDFK